MSDCKPPFPWFGGKSRVAHIVWQAFGNVPNYIEPFFGSGAVLFARPHAPKIETVNDYDGFVANFWRAVQAAPDAVAHYADWPVNENDLHARHAWLVEQRDGLQARLEGDPDYYDAKIAGWWVWGVSCWIGRRFCSGAGPWHRVDGLLVNLNDGNAGRGVNRQVPHLGNAGRGVNRQLPHLGDAGCGVNRKLPCLGAGCGVNRKLPCLGDAGRGVNRQLPLAEYITSLAERLRNVRVCCGDWSRICGPSPTVKNGLTGVFLDPPYSHDVRDGDLYRMESGDVSVAVREWAIAHGDDPKMRIALCGYDNEHTAMQDTWTEYAWGANGGYGSQSSGRGRDNGARERIWFSPHCLPVGQQYDMFAVCAQEVAND